MRRWTALLGAAVLLAVIAAGCGSGGSGTSSESSTPTEAQGEGGGKKVFYISPTSSQPGQQQVNLGLERAAAELGWSETVLDSALSPDKQVSNIETAISQGAAALASWTLDPNAVGGAYQQAQEKNIPVIGINSAGTGVTSTVWWENTLCEPGGPQGVSAEKIAAIHPHAKTIMIGLEVAESTKALSECFLKEAKKFGLDIINNTNNEADSASGSQKVFEPLLTKYPEVEAVWCYNDESALGVSAALLAAGKKIATPENPEGVVLTGENGDKGAIEAVEEGRLSWTWDPDNLATGYAAVLAMDEALKGEKPGDVVIESKLVDAENVGEYVPPEDREYTLETLPIKGKA